MKAQVTDSQKVDREEWNEFLKHSPQGMLYAQPGYLDIVAKEWKLVTVRDQKKLLGGMVLCPKKRRGFWQSHQPPYSQFLGPILSDDAHHPAWKQYGGRLKVLETLIGAIPKEIRWINHNCHPDFDYGIPFHWADYHLSMRYTWRIQPRGDDWPSEMDGDKRYQARRFERSGGEFRWLDAEEAARLLPEVARRAMAAGRGVANAVGLEMMPQIIHWMYKWDKGRALAAEVNGHTAVCLVAEDRDLMVYLFGAADEAALKEGAKTALILKALERCAEKGWTFDFEGSMIRGIEAFIRGFSARPTPYLNIEKNQLPLLLQWIKTLRS